MPTPRPSFARLAVPVALAVAGILGSTPDAAEAQARMTVPAVSYVAVSFDDLPGWRGDDHAAAMTAFLRSCPMVLAAAHSGRKPGVAAAAAALTYACGEAVRLSAAGRITEAVGRAFFEGYFTPHRVEHNGSAGLLTGYYEPVVDGSRTRTAKFPIPIHRRPPDLVNVVDESMRGAKSDGLTHGRLTPSGIEAYATRAQIDQGALAGKGLELLYLADAVERFFMQVQGSGRIRLADGTFVRVTYDGKNGHPYTSIGRHLIDSGEVGADKMSLAALGQWLRADASRGQKVMWLNKSYVFFREVGGDEAQGAMGVQHIPLTPGRSLAVDAGVHTIGTPVYVAAPALTHATRSGGFNRLMIAQDVGSAIKGPERGDIYFGTGDAAGRLAGVTKHPGRFYVLVPNGSGAVSASPGPSNALSVGSIRSRKAP